ncbi:hypothetical protein L7F22_014508 [Adiantum nelumboides]|nr:hypothetical protein [Adiantum nelumboides]
MQERKQRKDGMLFWAFLISLLLSPSIHSAASTPQFCEDDIATDAELFFPPDEVAVFSNTTANGVRRQGVDTALRKYSFMALSHARTSIIYNVPLTPFLSGIVCQAMHVRAGSAHRRGLVFNEFTIPLGMILQTRGPFVIMVYRKIANFTLYSAPSGYELASHVVGIVIYTNLNTTLDDFPLLEMTVLSPNTSIIAKLYILYQSLNLPLIKVCPLVRI